MLQAVQTAKPPAGAKKVYFIDVIGNKTQDRQEGQPALLGHLGLHAGVQAGHRRRRAGTFGNAGYDLTVKNGISLLKTDKAPAAAWAKVNAGRAGIASGKIKIPLTPTRAAAGQAPEPVAEPSEPSPAATAAGLVPPTCEEWPNPHRSPPRSRPRARTPPRSS